jgi:hypothetical protein
MQLSSEVQRQYSDLAELSSSEARQHDLLALSRSMLSTMQETTQPRSSFG